jgi:hypothetical protein
MKERPERRKHQKQEWKNERRKLVPRKGRDERKNGNMKEGQQGTQH